MFRVLDRLAQKYPFFYFSLFCLSQGAFVFLLLPFAFPPGSSIGIAPRLITELLWVSVTIVFGRPLINLLK
jgi:hypothetical protein